MLFQRFPHRPPVLRGRLHDDFLDILLDQPVGQTAQIGRRRPDLVAVEVKVAVDLDVGHDDREHLLVDVNSRDPVRHRSLLMGAESVPPRITQGPSYHRFVREPDDAQLFGQSRTLRIKQLLGFDYSVANLNLAAPSPAFCPILDFHSLSRASRPSPNQLRKSSSAASRISKNFNHLQLMAALCRAPRATGVSSRKFGFSLAISAFLSDRIAREL